MSALEAISHRHATEAAAERAAIELADRLDMLAVWA